MFLDLAHTRLDAYKLSLQFNKDCIRLVNTLPAEEKFSLGLQIRRAAISVVLNLAEGSSRRSQLEKRRFYEISRSSVVEVDAALDLVENLGYQNFESILFMKDATIGMYKMLTGMMKANEK